MNILNKITKVFRNIPSKIYESKQRTSFKKKIVNVKTSNRNIIFLFCAPTHSNLGDQAQLMCWLKLFKEWYPNYEVITVSTKYRDFYTLRLIRDVIKRNDKIFIHSGYLIFDPHPELPFILDVIRAFYDHPITILPQTINLMGEWYRRIVARQFTAHTNLTLICRDEISLKYAEELFPNIKLKLMPDVVTFLIGDKDFVYDNYNRNGIMLCVRNDREKLYTSDQIDIFKKRFKGLKVDQSDTTINLPIWVWEKKRELLIRDVIEQFSHYKVIITDRYHGTIFSLIANTPVIVLSSTDHKLSSGVNWFPKEIYGNMIHFALCLDDAFTLAKKILDNCDTKSNPPYLRDKYYNKSIV